MQSIEIISINTSDAKGTVKKAVSDAMLTLDGIQGDAHSGKWHRQISLLGIESIIPFSATTGKTFDYGDFAENITTKGMILKHTRPGDRFVGKSVELMVTQIGKKCHGGGCAIYQESGACIMPKEGIFATVTKPGCIKCGDILEYHPKVYKIGVITLSTRASEGIYPDLSGPGIIEEIKRFSDSIQWKISTQYHLIPDDKERLNSILSDMITSKFDIIFTTGGTGIGPHDFTPEVVKPLLNKELCGIMDFIRLKYGAIKPNALMSRSIAGVANDSLVFVLPGSLKAVKEYMAEIVPLLEHLIFMKIGIDNH